LIPSKDKEECKISQLIADYSDQSIQGFGSSDCNCKSHLHFFSEGNSFISSFSVI
jgi:Uri superfamily endonuclease